MSRRLMIGLTALVAVGLTFGLAWADEDFLRPEEAFRLTGQVMAPDRVSLRWAIADGYYLYRDKLVVASATDGIGLGPITWPQTETKDDAYFGEVAIYRDRLDLQVPLGRASEASDRLTLQVTYQGCADAGLCYPPEQRSLQLDLPPADPSWRAMAPTPTVGQALGQPMAGLERSLGLANNDTDLLAVEEAFRPTAAAIAPDRLRVTWAIAAGTYLYRDGMALALEETAGIALGDFAWPAPLIERDGIRPDGEIGDVAIYREQVTLDVPLRLGPNAPSEVMLVARYQGCAELGVCYPPQTRRLPVSLPGGAEMTRRGEPLAAGDAPPTEPGPISEQDRLAAALAGGSLWGIVALFFGLGLLLSLTPCVFPMIPILSGIIAGQGHRLTTRRAFVLSLVYVLAMAVTYTLAGVLAGLFGANLQAAFQNAWILGAFALVFVALALSMFGLYELQMPAALQTRLAELSQRQRGGTLVGVAIMGLLSALIVGPCVAPPLAGALIFIGQTGNALLGGLALFALSLGMGAPLILIGVTAGKLMPRAGAWMDAVKAVFGVLLLAVAIWLLERVLPGALTMLLWGLLLICSAVFMGALQPAAPGVSGWTRLWRGLGIALLVYGILMLVGAAAGSRDPLQPLRGLTLGAENAVSALSFKPIKTVADLERELALANAAGRPLMLDFYADWCVTCKELEHKTFAAPAVQRELAGFVLLQADVTANDADDRALLQGRFGLPGPPLVVFFDRDGVERRGLRVVGFKSPTELVAHLQGARL